MGLTYKPALAKSSALRRIVPLHQLDSRLRASVTGSTRFGIVLDVSPARIRRRASRRIEAGSVAGKFDPVALKIAGGVVPLTVLVNGLPLMTPGGRRSLMFALDGPGFVRVTVMDANGSADSVTVRLQ